MYRNENTFEKIKIWIRKNTVITALIIGGILIIFMNQMSSKKTQTANQALSNNLPSPTIEDSNLADDLTDDSETDSSDDDSSGDDNSNSEDVLQDDESPSSPSPSATSNQDDEEVDLSSNNDNLVTPSSSPLTSPNLPSPTPRNSPSTSTSTSTTNSGNNSSANTSTRKINFSGSTKQKVLDYLKEYSPDGHCIVSQSGISDSLYEKYAGGKFNKVEILVYESCHLLNKKRAGNNSSSVSFFMGNKNFIDTKKINTFNPSEIANSIPNNLRTFRYKSYIEKPAVRNRNFYGLVQEFNSYYNSCKSTFDTYEYYSATNKWNDYTHEMQTFAAYYEFKFYILKYLQYAKSHHSNIYNSIMGQKALKEAFNKTDSNYMNLVNSYLRQLENNRNISSGKPVIGMNNYNTMKAETEKSEYRNILEDIKK